MHACTYVRRVSEDIGLANIVVRTCVRSCWHGEEGLAPSTSSPTQLSTYLCTYRHRLTCCYSAGSSHQRTYIRMAHIRMHVFMYARVLKHISLENIGVCTHARTCWHFVGGGGGTLIGVPPLKFPHTKILPLENITMVKNPLNLGTKCLTPLKLRKI